VVKPDPRITLGAGVSQQFVAGGADQYGNRITDVSMAWTGSEGGAIDGDGLFVAGSEPGVFNNAVPVDISSGDVTLTTKVDVTVEAARITYYSIDADGLAVDIFTIDPDGTNQKTIDSFGNTLEPVSWAPNGRRLVFGIFATTGGIFAMDDDDDSLFRITSNVLPEVDIAPAISPDGTRIAFIRTNLATSEDDIYLVDFDGGDVTKVTDTPDAGVFVPAWSPDGQWIVYDLTPDGGSGDIWKIRPDGTEATRLTTNPANETWPIYSPDGTKIVYTSSQDGDAELFVMDDDGSSARQLTNNDDFDSSPTWSPDGTLIAFVSDRDGDREIWVMDVDGGNDAQVTDNDFSDFDPVWALPKAGIPYSDDALTFTDIAKPDDRAVAEVTAAARGAVVRVLRDDGGSGSGFIVDASGLVVTNNHVVVGAEELTIVLDDGTELAGTVVGRDLVRDLAVVRVTGADGPLPVLRIATVNGPQLGGTVLVLGYPLRTATLNITRGIASTFAFSLGKNAGQVQTDAAVNPGNSGGPLVNLRGEVVGVVSAKLVGTSIEGVGLAIDAETLRTYIDRLSAGETIKS
jgi:S1-C subfamily serine protease